MRLSNSKEQIAEIAKAEELAKADNGRRAYESQLVAAFAVSFGVIWREKNPAAPIGLNYFQGNKDRNFADFMGNIGDRFWLLELKRGEPEISDEGQKPLRVAQYEKLNEDSDMKAIGLRCHWLAFGHESKHLVKLNYSKYWETVFESNKSSAMNNVKFFNLCFDHNEKFGVDGDSFRKYLKFLVEIARDKGYKNSEDELLTLVFRMSKHEVQYLIEPNFLSIIREIDSNKPKIVKELPDPLKYKGLAVDAKIHTQNPPNI